MITRKKLTITEYSCYKIRQRRAYLLILFQKEISLRSRKKISPVTPLTPISLFEKATSVLKLGLFGKEKVLLKLLFFIQPQFSLT